MINALERMTVTVPEGELDGLRIERFTVTADDPEHLYHMLHGGRQTRPGTYTKLSTPTTLWMTDTDAEKRDHLPAVHAIRRWEAQRVLINGLGLGMVLAAALTFDHVEHIDVIEHDERVIKLVGPHYATDPRVKYYLADAFEQARNWPRNSRWDVIWSDIWPSLCLDNLPEMTQLLRSYARRCDWHGCWGRDFLLKVRANQRKNPYASWHL
jgi:hypothetical protein